MKAKYIIIDNRLGVIFPDFVQHVDMAAYLRHKGEVTSAGFVSYHCPDYYSLNIEAHGESISLGIKSKPEEDSRLLTRMLQGY